MTELSKETSKRLKQNIYLAIIKYFGLFFSFAIISALIGRFIDNQFDIKPYGTLAIMGVSMILSWGVVIYTYKSMQKVPSEQKPEN